MTAEDAVRQSNANNGHRHAMPARRGTGSELRLLSPPARTCPPSAPCADGIVGAPDQQRREREPYPPDTLDNAEAAELIRAAVAASAEAARAPTLAERAVRELFACHGRSDAAATKLESFAASGRLPRARAAMAEVIARHAEDGPEDRRHRPKWASGWLVLVPVLAATLFDTLYFAKVFQRITDAGSGWDSVLTYLPGFMIAGALAATAHWTGQALLRGRSLAERRDRRITLWARIVAAVRRRPPTVQQRTPKDLPWPQWTLPALFGGLVLLTVLVWSFYRAQSSDADTGPPFAVALLLLMLTVSAIAIKVVHHNPFADAARAAERDVQRAEKRFQTLVEKSSDAVGEHAAAEQKAYAALAEAEGRVLGHLESAWTRILERRDQHGLAGDLAPPFAAADRADAAAGVAVMFDGMAQPPVRLEPLAAVRATVEAYGADAVRQRVHRVVAALTRE
ncbi:hypothetical protein [Gandjariella thermophila]|uniref:Uncharacterized protein n=1 Tax=Gandjariella thermophila TaxID=1931992 RepID=A0A4D4J7B6_9PSEU|nr:hypothetical protein [Gandjariella thermophila]GDY32551.1 hypothetical protein GTS_41840 [Gandjariella thermophila]